MNKMILVFVSVASLYAHEAFINIVDKAEHTPHDLYTVLAQEESPYDLPERIVERLNVSLYNIEHNTEQQRIVNEYNAIKTTPVIHPNH